MTTDTSPFEKMNTIAKQIKEQALERDEFRFVHILSLPSSVSTVRV